MAGRVFGTRAALRFVHDSSQEGTPVGYPAFRDTSAFAHLSPAFNTSRLTLAFLQARTVEHNMPEDSQAFMATWKGKPIEGVMCSRTGSV